MQCRFVFHGRSEVNLPSLVFFLYSYGVVHFFLAKIYNINCACGGGARHDANNWVGII